MARSGVREIVVLGRRGPAQAAFTNPEIKELGEMRDADIVVDPAEVELDPASSAWIESDEADKTSRVNVEILREFSQRPPEGKRRRIVLRFLASPIEILGDGKVEKMVIGRNELVDVDGTLRAKDSGERGELECGLVLRSVGYTGVPIEGVPFDEKRGTILNEGGRVLDSHDGGHKVGHYAAGWIKRGPSGVIGTNKKDAMETITHLLEDAAGGSLLEPASPEPATSASRTGRRSTRPRWAAASRTDAHESSSSASRRCSRRSARRSASRRAGPAAAHGARRGRGRHPDRPAVAAARW
jgi:ferredoxin/flavodoxin---NADP+ reductase